MVAQRQCRVRKPRDKREGREERQKPEEEGSKESQESMLLKREDFIVSCAQQTLFAVVVRRTIGVLRNGSSEQSYNAPLAAYHNSQPLTTTLRRFSPKTAFGRQINTTPMRFHAICGTMTPCGQTSTFSTPEDNSEASNDNIVISYPTVPWRLYTGSSRPLTVLGYSPSALLHFEQTRRTSFSEEETPCALID